MLPTQYLERMKEMLDSEYLAFLNSYHQTCAQALRFNPQKGSRDQFLLRAPFHLTPVPWEPNGFYYEAKDAPGRHPYHAAGVYYIQEPSAMAPAVYLDARPGERILDLCAAPGGKSTQIAAAMQGQGLLVSNEIHPARARILSENIERMGVRNCMVLNESPQALARVFPSYFDRILVDAPCSGEGMFRKNEDACREWSSENVALCAERQLDILSCAAPMLAPGGRMVYSTCTFSPEENEGTVSRFLAAHPEFSLVPAERFCGMSGGRPDWTQAPADGIAHTIRLFPHRLCGEGHFLAVLQKDGEPCARRCILDTETGIREKDCADFTRFREEYLSAELHGTLVRFGDQLYLAPEGIPATRGLKVLRPGLHLGVLKKDRFEPGHALALALSAKDCIHTLDLSADSRDIRAYLNGQTLPASGKKGWYLVTVDGCSIGWGKLTGAILKNHYPKGLRTPHI